MYYQPDTKQLIDDAELTLSYNLRPGNHSIILGYGLHYVEDNSPEYDWITQRLVKGNIRKISNSPYYKFLYTIEELTEEEITINREKKRQLDWIPFREQRDDLLKESDWTQINDYSLVTEEEKALWALYREELRNLPETYPNSADIVWPSKPQPSIVFTNPPPQVAEEPVIIFNEPVVTEEPIIFSNNTTSGSFEVTSIFGNTTSSFGSDTTMIFS
jgi:hypothetical protein